MPGRRALAVACIAICATIIAPSPTRAAPQDIQLWTPVYLNVGYTDQILGWWEAQPRFGEDVSQATQLLLRTALGYRFAARWSAWLGYAWIPSFHPLRTENRLYQQLLYNGRHPFGSLMSRTRFEQRWIEGASGTALRLRTMLRGRLPITKDDRWGAVVQDEIFVNLNSPRGGPAAGFDQNRLFLGVNRTLGAHLNVDFGYQLQTVETTEPGFVNLINHVLVLQLFVNL